MIQSPELTDAYVLARTATTPSPTATPSTLATSSAPSAAATTAAAMPARASPASASSSRSKPNAPPPAIWPTPPMPSRSRAALPARRNALHLSGERKHGRSAPLNAHPTNKPRLGSWGSFSAPAPEPSAARAELQGQSPWCCERDRYPKGQDKHASPFGLVSEASRARPEGIAQ